MRAACRWNRWRPSLFVRQGVGLDGKNSPLEGNRKLFCSRLIRIYLRSSLR